MKLPNPPSNIQNCKIDILRAGKRLVRFYNRRRTTWKTPRTFGPLTRMRFEHHLPPRRHHKVEAVWYAAGSLRGAVAETFGNDPRIIDKGMGTRVCLVELSKPLRLLSLYGNGPRVLDRALDQRICTTTRYETCRKWARAIYEQFPDLVGLRWKGRQLGTENVVLTDRADFDSLVLIDDRDISDPAVWPRIAAAAYHCNIRVVG